MSIMIRRWLLLMIFLLLADLAMHLFDIPHANDLYGVIICLFLLLAGWPFLRQNRYMLRWILFSSGIFFTGQVLDWLEEFWPIPRIIDFMDDFLRSTAFLIMGWALFDLMKQQEALRHELEQEVALNKRLHQEADYLAFHDELTGLGNRRALFRELARQHREAESGLLFYIDLNDFKLLNDTRGHEAGDEALREVSRALQWMSARAYRLGGDEFVLLLDAQQSLTELREDILRLTAHLQPNFGISACIGSASYSADELQQPDLILARADASMYREKEAHRQLRRACR